MRFLDTDFDFQTLKTTGIKINYLYVCERKLWLFDRGITMEAKSDKVLMGRLLGETSFPKEEKRDLLIDNLIRIDILDDDTIREVKYSNKLRDADRIQLLYYLYYLEKLGIKKKGVIHYPKMKKKEEIELTDEARLKVEDALVKVKQILDRETPPPIEEKSYCRKCAYFEFCFG